MSVDVFAVLKADHDDLVRTLDNNHRQVLMAEGALQYNERLTNKLSELFNSQANPEAPKEPAPAG